MQASEGYDLEALQEGLRKGVAIPEAQLQTVCADVKALFAKEDNLVKLQAPLVVVGDIHGQYYDLLKLFDLAGPPPQNSYLFLGDYVNRGHHSVETIELLFVLKLRYPNRITMLRGNHECRQVTQIYGFFDEVNKKYGNSNPHTWITDVFDYLPLGALINDKVVAFHAGIGPSLQTLDQLTTLNRIREVPTEGLITDLMWSDPDDNTADWGVNPRGAGYLFGSNAMKQFAHKNNVELLVRSHQLVNEGFKYSFPEENVLTVWSAPNYCYKCGNVGAYLKLDGYLNRETPTFTESEFAAEEKPTGNHPYFL